MSVIIKSLPYFNQLKTFVLYFLILPIFQALLYVLIAQDYIGENTQHIMTASIILSGATMSLNMITSLFVGDISRGIAQLIAVDYPYSMYYWGTRFFVCFISSYVLVLINGSIFYLLNLVHFSFILWLAPICIISGLIMGLCGCFLSWGYSNIYFWSNFFSSCVVLFGGAIGAVSQYPAVFKWVSYLFPMGQLLEVVHGYPIDVIGVTINLFVWTVLTLGTYHYQLKRITKKNHHGLF
ncbi:hypothetical protein [Atopobacter phocae]|uniref:hypothetical protein n=1 Tax=Atopobacter phocae TaxID=136492 RepID=UPI00046E6089|nr:hypothetical protein [Atopobacter phocae]